jgi:hypothetical protein
VRKRHLLALVMLLLSSCESGKTEKFNKYRLAAAIRELIHDGKINRSELFERFGKPTSSESLNGGRRMLEYKCESGYVGVYVSDETTTDFVVFDVKEHVYFSEIATCGCLPQWCFWPLVVILILFLIIHAHATKQSPPPTNQSRPTNQSPTTRQSPASNRSPYVNHCYCCKAPVNDGAMPRCSRCRWVICAACGACGCGYSG